MLGWKGSYPRIGELPLKSALLILLWAVAMPHAHAQDLQQELRFLKQHWAYPIAPQGKAPRTYSALEASLNPDSCGTCHPKQYEGWKKSRHAYAMGPGVMGQLLETSPEAKGDLQNCLRCHAPLAEQEKSLDMQLQGKKQKNALHERGLVCAACHVRHNVRFGPPPVKSAATHAHGGFVVSTAFESGRFCATCHQFDKDGYVLNGKPLENTYAEWRSSVYAKRGIQCQGCHMPNRLHLWRGIHDPEMSAQGITIKPDTPIVKQGVLFSALEVANTGTGHDFPTYVTPRVLVEIYQEEKDGKLIEGTLREAVIGRLVAPDLSKEISDTRLAPGREMKLKYNVPKNAQAAALVMKIRVEPDHFYTGLYRALIASQSRGHDLIRSALLNSIGSSYDLYLRRYPIH